MIAALMIYAVVVGAFVGGVAMLLNHTARLWRLSTRWIWAGALLLLVVVTALASERRVGDTWKILGDSGTVVESLEHSAALASMASGALLRTARELAAESIERPVRAALSALPSESNIWLAALWFALSLGALGVMMSVLGRLRQARRAWPIANLHGDRVRIAPNGGPAVIGLAHPEIVIPRWLLGCTDADQRLVLAHEREHLRAGDHLLLFSGCVALAIMPWNPAVWWMLSRLRLAVELDCDARVLRLGAPPRSYGTLLIELANRCTGLPVGAPALADEPSHLEQRLLAMKPNVVRFASLRAASFAAIALLGLIAACESRLPTASEIEAMDVTSAETQMKRLPLLKPDSGDVLYLVDGLVWNEKAVRALTPEEIAIIEVERGDDEEQSTVAVTTRAFMAKQLPGDTTRDHFRIRVDDPRAATFQEKVDGTHPKTALRAFEGVIVLDGKVVGESAMARLDPSRIHSVEVLKGDAAARQYPDIAEARKGVIRITTKQ
jgi:beta-lactamase regulating signal transducer with metallopeptidase domain